MQRVSAATCCATPTSDHEIGFLETHYLSGVRASSGMAAEPKRQLSLFGVNRLGDELESEVIFRVF